MDAYFLIPVVVVFFLFLVRFGPETKNSYFVSYIGYVETVTTYHHVYGSTIICTNFKTQADLDSICTQIQKANNFQRVVPLVITPVP